MIIDRLNLTVKIDGHPVRVRPSSLTLEQYAACLPVCKVMFSGENRPKASTEKAVLFLGQKIIFTGYLLSAGAIRGGQYITFGYEPGSSLGNYRKEKAPYIFDDLVSQCGLKKGDVNIPDVEFPRAHFSGNGWTNLLDFADSLSDFTDDDYDLYMTPDGVLTVCPVKKSDTIKADFNRGKNALLITDKKVTAFPAPLAYGDFVRVNDQVKRIIGLRYSISPQNSIMEVLF